MTDAARPRVEAPLPSRSQHTFHIPIMGTSFTIDTPLQVARYGVSSVVSLVDDVLVEQMRKYHSVREGLPYDEIRSDEEDARARRITAYLDLLDRLLAGQVRELQSSPFEEGSEITRYYEMLPETPLKEDYRRMVALPEGPERSRKQEALRTRAVPGTIDVNIMTKIDRTVYRDGKALPPEYSEAMAALRGFGCSGVSSSIVFSAGMNPRLYSYASTFEDFHPDGEGRLKKKITLKVSDYRSAVIQGRFFAKRGLWVSEYRIESGLNCGGHSFPTSGHLMGPILAEFSRNRQDLREMLHKSYAKALSARGRKVPEEPLEMLLSVQGGIGNVEEDQFLLTHYNVDSTGWGSPFLLCPDVVTLDEEHQHKLARAGHGDVWLSGSSPLGLPFWNLRASASEERRRRRISEKRPGSPCPKGYLKADTEFTEIPTCRAGRAYQKKKLEHLPGEGLTAEQLSVVTGEVLAKSCLCEDLAGAASLKNGTDPDARTAVCPGPNIVYFSELSSLDEMVGHIYGRLSLLEGVDRPHMFIEELKIYVGYLRGEAEKCSLGLSSRQPKYFLEFKENLLQGIGYYRQLSGEFAEQRGDPFRRDLKALQVELEEILLPSGD